MLTILMYQGVQYPNMIFDTRWSITTIRLQGIQSIPNTILDCHKNIVIGYIVASTCSKICLTSCDFSRLKLITNVEELED